MALNIGNTAIGKAFVGNAQIGKAYVGNVLVYNAESDPITLTNSVQQNEGSMRWADDVDYLITEDWETLTVIDSHWGKSYGEFQTILYLIDGNTTKTLADRHGGYSGYPMANEPIVASGTKFAVKKGQTIRLSVGASYDKNVSQSFTTTSYITFKLT